jgi:hypothetical protein
LRSIEDPAPEDPKFKFTAIPIGQKIEIED